MVAVAVFRFPVAPGMIRLSMGMLFDLLVVAIVAAWVWKASPYAGGLLVLSAFSMVYPIYGKWGFLAFHDIMFGLLFFSMLVYAFRKYPGETSTVMDAICVIAVANLLFQFMQALKIDPLYKPMSSGTVGLMTNQNEVSALLAFSVPAFLRPKWIWWTPLVLLGLVLAETFSGVLSVGAGALFLALCLCRRKLIIVGVGAVAVIVFGAYAALVDLPGMERLSIWWYAIKTIFTSAQNPVLYLLFGAGIGHWPWVMERAGFSAWWTMAHNVYLQGVFEMGIGFLVLVGLYLRDAYKRYQPTAILPAMAVIIIGVNSAVNFAIHIPVTAMLIIAWLAIYQVETDPHE